MLFKNKQVLNIIFFIISFSIFKDMQSMLAIKVVPFVSANPSFDYGLNGYIFSSYNASLDEIILLLYLTLVCSKPIIAHPTRES